MDLQQMEQTSTQLSQAGFIAAALEVNKKIALARKLAVAYEHFRYVKVEQVESFNKKLRETTLRKPKDADEKRAALYARYGSNYYMMYDSAVVLEICDKLVFDNLEKYSGVPPTDVLNKVIEAKNLKCFDTFQVAHIQPYATQVILPDPIVFGYVNGCSDSFFIAEWGNDVNISDLIGKNDG